MEIPTQKESLAEKEKNRLEIPIELHCKAFVFSLISNDNGEMLIGIRDDGVIVYGKSYSPDKAAKIFWNALSELNPLHTRINNITKELNNERIKNRQLHHEIDRLIRELSMAKMKTRD